MDESCIIEPLPVFGGERRIYQGFAQPFAAHAHDHFLFGIVREGERTLSLNGALYYSSHTPGSGKSECLPGWKHAPDYSSDFQRSG